VQVGAALGLVKTLAFAVIGTFAATAMEAMVMLIARPIMWATEQKQPAPLPFYIWRAAIDLEQHEWHTLTGSSH
jgi:hypothetical protein